MTTTARLLGARLVGVVVLAAAFLVVSGRASDTGLAAAEAVRCPGNNTEQQAPFSCTATKVIADIGFTAVVDVDSDGRAVVDVSMSPTQTDPVVVVVRSYTGVASEPVVTVEGTILPGETAVRLVLPRVNCGQLDVKALYTTQGDRRGHIAGPRVTWGNSCAVQPVSTTTVPLTTAAPTTALVAAGPAEAPGALPSELPSTGAGLPVVPWALGALGLSAVLLAAARRR